MNSFLWRVAMPVIGMRSVDDFTAPVNNFFLAHTKLLIRLQHGARPEVGLDFSMPHWL